MRTSRPLIIGITGSLGTGKTTVARLMKGLGAKVIDADALAHAALRTGTPAFRSVIAAFGGGIKDERGAIDRKRLAALVFGDRARLRELCRIIHPPVVRAIEREIAGEKKRKVIVVDAPLLIEAGLNHTCDAVVVVTASRANQIARCRKRSGMTKEETLARIKDQMPLRKKVEMADYVISNDRALKETKRKVQTVWRVLWK